MIMRTLGRLVWVPIAFVISGAATVLLLVLIAKERIAEALPRGEADLGTLSAILDLARQGHLLLSSLTLIPALLVVIVGEVARIRSMLYYVIGGGLALAAVPLLARYGQAPAGAPISSLMPPTLVWQIFATSGFLGGWIYWMLSGRSA